MKKILLIVLLVILIGCQETESHTILEGHAMETEVIYYDSQVPGKRIAIIAGIHGDEVAGWQAADMIVKDLKKYIKKGQVMIIAHANQVAIDEERRYGEAYGDLNRTFLGDGDNDSVVLSQEIMEKIISFEADLVIDHHESLNNYQNNRLGNTIIISDQGDNILSGLEILDIINPQIVDDIPFVIETNPPVGSINRTLSEEHGLLTITIETNRKLKLDKRIEEQLIVFSSIYQYINK